jgi:carboxymethylenebutenolidase
MTERKKASDFPQAILKLFDGYVHGHIERRDFLEGAAKVLGGGAAALGVLEALQPEYAWAAHVPPADERIQERYVTYPSPQGSGTMRGYMATPTGAAGPRPAVLVIHENRGLNPYIEDVVRRFAAADFVALGPDALTPLGGYPGNDDEGRNCAPKRLRKNASSARMMKKYSPKKKASATSATHTSWARSSSPSTMKRLPT